MSTSKAEWLSPRNILQPGIFPKGCCVEQAGKWGVIDRYGHFVLGPRFDEPMAFIEGYATVVVDGKHGMVDKKGEFLIAPSWDELDGFSEGLASVKINGKWGYIDHRGTLKIPAVFRASAEFKDGVALRVNMERKDAHGEGPFWVDAFGEIRPWDADKAE